MLRSFFFQSERFAFSRNFILSTLTVYILQGRCTKRVFPSLILLSRGRKASESSRSGATKYVYPMLEYQWLHLMTSCNRCVLRTCAPKRIFELCASNWRQISAYHGRISWLRLYVCATRLADMKRMPLLFSLEEVQVHTSKTIKNRVCLFEPRLVRISTCMPLQNSSTRFQMVQVHVWMQIKNYTCAYFLVQQDWSAWLH